ncbi:PhoPQ-activated protein PqaA family protein [Thiocystis violascens]|uniref:PhoPQ-activated protein PqaA family protein n=1 Tax=Thiocystis violascens TaxID=73141 RepID=UPI00022C2D9B|nr:PhoPQ-activated protein PqaA family protein [Thiocystis violascens]
MSIRLARGTLALGWCMALMLTVTAQVAAETALDEYVARPDPAYRYRLYQTDRTFAYTTYFLQMTSQQWRTAAEVDRPLWTHEIQVTVPNLRYSSSPRTALLIVNGGRNGRPLDTETGELLSTLALVTGSVVAMVNQIPNQPLYLTDEIDVPRSEDALLAYSLDKVLTTGDPAWAVHFAMTKAVVRAMDTVQTWLRWRRVRIDDFIVLGGSKRGWTAWLAAAVDPRVKAVVPVSSDLLNLSRQFTHQWEALGFYTPAIADYVAFDLPCRAQSPEAQSLLEIIDPYFYRDRYTMPGSAPIYRI